MSSLAEAYKINVLCEDEVAVDYLKKIIFRQFGGFMKVIPTLIQSQPKCPLMLQRVQWFWQ